MMLKRKFNAHYTETKTGKSNNINLPVYQVIAEYKPVV